MKNTWLAEYRKKAGMTQKQAAERSGISQSAYCKIENGITSPMIDTTYHISEALGFDINEWLKMKPKEKKHDC